MINIQRKIITYIALKKFFIYSSDLNPHRSMDVLGAETGCNKLYSKIKASYLWSAVSLLRLLYELSQISSCQGTRVALRNSTHHK